TSLRKRMTAGELAVKVPVEKAEETRRKLININLLDRGRRIVREGDTVYIPVTNIPEGEFEVVSKHLPSSKTEHVTYTKISFDIVGEIAVINDMDLPLERAEAFAGEIVKRHKRVRTVLQKVGEVSGEERIASYRVVYGEPFTETVHRESGCVFKLDVGKVFFSPRLSTERLRIASQVKENEVVLDMFAGVGPFSIVIARKHPSATVYAIEKNPEAYQYLVENIRLNKVTDRVKPLHGDAAEIVPAIDRRFTRVIMNLPRQSINYLLTAVGKTSSNAVIHLYVVENRGEREETIRRIEAVSKGLAVRNERVVKDVSPKAVLKVYDLEVL
ncbi:MAG: class I SAM-dependent methyltransferase family protein, partial [Candidatus Caldarchaeum sp.]|nr:class I SAM-dependent methyltransferase family protein [Candidatus Caldarchaeum sp.]